MTSPALRRAAAGVLSLTAISVLLLSACGAPNELVPVGNGNLVDPSTWTFAEGTVQADSNETRDFTVESDGNVVRIPAGHDAFVAKLQPGTVVLGDRAPGFAPNNPGGFFGKVVSVQPSATDTVVQLEEVAFNQLFDQADLHLDGEPDYAAGAAPTSLDLLDDQSQLDRTITLRDSSSWSLGQLNAPSLQGKVKFAVSSNTEIDVRERIRVDYTQAGWLSLPKMKVTSRTNSTTRYRWCGSIEVQRGVGQTDMVGTTKELAKFNLPMPPLGPIPMVAEISGKIVCGPFGAGQARFTYRSTSRDERATEFGFDGSFFQNSLPIADPTGDSTYSLETQGTVGFGCELKIRFAALAASRAGLFFQAVPRAEASMSSIQDVAQGGSQTCLNLNAQGKAELGLTASLWGLNTEYTYSPDFAKLGPYSLFKACAGGDVCGGKADGWYCSMSNKSASYRCTGGTKSLGTSCQTNEFCQHDGKYKAEMSGDSPKCDRNEPILTNRPEIQCN